MACGEGYSMQWSTLTTFCRSNPSVDRSLRDFYSRVSLSYRVRSRFAEWIETQSWSRIQKEVEKGDTRSAESAFQSLLKMVSEHGDQIRESFKIEKVWDWTDMKESLMKSFGEDITAFVAVMIRCLDKERELIESVIDNGPGLRRKRANGPRTITDDLPSLRDQLSSLKQQIEKSGTAVEAVKQKQYQFLAEHRQLQDEAAELEKETSPSVHARKDKILNDINQLATDYLNERNELCQHVFGLERDLRDALSVVWALIGAWQDEQKRSIALLVRDFSLSLDDIDALCEDVGSVLVQLIRQVESLLDVCRAVTYDNDAHRANLEKLLQQLKGNTLQQHVQHIMVVERYTPQRILKFTSGKSDAFSTTIRLLGGTGLGLGGLNIPKVRMASYLDKNIPRDRGFNGTGTEGLTGRDRGFNGTGTEACTVANGAEREFAIERSTRACKAHFQGVVLSRLKRPGKSETDLLVTEQKYAFVFYSTLNLCGLTFELKTISMPIIFTTQSSQEVMARGTLLWDAAFSESSRVPFECRESVKWSEFAEVLSTLFLHNTERALSADQLNYLGRMALRLPEPKQGRERLPTNLDDLLISKKSVFREKLSSSCSSGRESSTELNFWSWLCACMNLLRLHAKPEWRAGKIEGFMSKSTAQRKLKKAPVGTFLLRFSESDIQSSQSTDVCAEMSVAFVERDPITDRKRVFHHKGSLSAANIREIGFSIILRAMVVKDSERPIHKKAVLQHLWPDTSSTFDDSFGEIINNYIVKKKKKDPDYVGGIVSIEIVLTDDLPRPSRESSSEGSSSNAEQENLTPQHVPRSHGMKLDSPALGHSSGTTSLERSSSVWSLTYPASDRTLGLQCPSGVAPQPSDVLGCSLATDVVSCDSASDATACQSASDVTTSCGSAMACVTSRVVTLVRVPSSSLRLPSTIDNAQSSSDLSGLERVEASKDPLRINDQTFLGSSNLKDDIDDICTEEMAGLFAKGTGMEPNLDNIISDLRSDPNLCSLDFSDHIRTGDEGNLRTDEDGDYMLPDVYDMLISDGSTFSSPLKRT